MWPKAWNRTIEVHAIADRSAKKGVRFELRNPTGSDNPPIQAGTPPRIPFNKEEESKKGNGDMKALDWHRVYFKLVDNDSLGLRFHDDKHQALWAMTATDTEKCPMRRCKHKHFRPLNRDDDVLIVRNDNYDPEEIGFTLNFLRPGDDGFDESTFVQCDPVGGNEDRGSGITQRSLIGATVAVAGVAAVGAAVLLSDMMRPMPRSRATRKAKTGRPR